VELPCGCSWWRPTGGATRLDVCGHARQPCTPPGGSWAWWWCASPRCLCRACGLDLCVVAPLNRGCVLPISAGSSAPPAPPAPSVGLGGVCARRHTLEGVEARSSVTSTSGCMGTQQAWCAWGSGQTPALKLTVARALSPTACGMRQEGGERGRRRDTPAWCRTAR
jgi:hypothetical protein